MSSSHPQVYRGYQLHCRARPVLGRSEWRPLLRIDRLAEGHTESHYVPLSQLEAFPSPEDAAVYATDFGRRWIDAQLDRRQRPPDSTPTGNSFPTVRQL
jgi:hypothetical protein